MEAKTKKRLKLFGLATGFALLLALSGILFLLWCAAVDDYAALRRKRDYEFVKRMADLNEGTICPISNMREYLNETGFSYAYVDLQDGRTLRMIEPSKELAGVYALYEGDYYYLAKKVNGECVLRRQHESALQPR